MTIRLFLSLTQQQSWLGAPHLQVNSVGTAVRSLFTTLMVAFTRSQASVYTQMEVTPTKMECARPLGASQYVRRQVRDISCVGSLVGQ